MIALEQVRIGYGGVPLLRPFDFHVAAGDFWGIVGPNGGGKTTLVKTIIGLNAPVSGAVRFRPRKPRFGYVPQRHVLPADYPLTAFDVVLMGRYDRLTLGARPSSGDRQRAAAELERVGMAGLADHRFGALSGGQQQRVLLARALAAEPDVLVLDEPTTGMDLPGEASILDFLRRIHAGRSMTILMIGHHISTVVSVVDHLCLINKDADLFDSGPLTELLTAERLSTAYRRPIEVAQAPGGYHVHAPEVEHE